MGYTKMVFLLILWGAGGQKGGVGFEAVYPTKDACETARQKEPSVGHPEFMRFECIAVEYRGP